MRGKQIHPLLFAFFVLFVANLNGAFWVHSQILRTGRRNGRWRFRSLIGIAFGPWGVGRKSEAESVGFHRRRVTRVGPEVKHGLFRVAGRAYNPKKLPPERRGAD